MIKQVSAAIGGARTAWPVLAMTGNCCALAWPALFALFDETRLRRILARMLDEQEFLGPHGIRAVSRWHADHPYVMVVDGREYRVSYLPAESDTGMFGGNSNWRGPVWFPIKMMLIRALLNLHLYFGGEFTVECPTGSGRQLNLFEVAREIGDRLTGTFTQTADGRPVHGERDIFQTSPYWRDLVLLRVLQRRQRIWRQCESPDRLDRHRRAPAVAVPRCREPSGCERAAVH